MTTELTRMAHEIKNGKGDFDGLLLRWSHHVKLEGWTVNKTRNFHDAQDLRQEVMMNVWERFKEFNEQVASFETWAFNRTRAVIRSWVRREIKRTGMTIPLEIYHHDNQELIQYDYGVYEDYTREIKQYIETKFVQTNRMQKNKLKTTLDTFEEILEKFRTKDETMLNLEISRSQLNCNLRRIGKAILDLEEDKLLEELESPL